jgi:hypothetical protein
VRPSVRSGVVASVAAIVAFPLATLHAGCSADSRDLFVVQYDAGSPAEGGAEDDGGSAIDPTIGGPCTEDTQCDDLIPCTYDKCDPAISRCRNTPDDSQCADTQYCNGVEKCVLRQGCVPGPVVSCEDDDGCTIDRCVEETKQCEHVARDADGDGDPDDHCVPNKDCDDTDPTVNSTVAEVCDNFKDDNCNGVIDEQPCSTPANDVCSTALAVHGPGTFLLSSVAARSDYTTGCPVSTPAAARDLVLAITVPSGGDAKDVFVRTATNTPVNDVAVSLQTSCGVPASEVSCGFVANAYEARAIARSVAAGGTVYAIVTTQKESAVDVHVDMLPASARPTNETCDGPAPVSVDVPFPVSLIDAKHDLASSCAAKTGELTYAFTLAEPHDVRIFASTVDGPGTPIVSMRSSTCTDELRCRTGSSPPVFVRSLDAGTHVLSVSGTTQLDASVLVETFPATTPPPNQTCATAPALQAGAEIEVDLSNSEEGTKNGCFAGGPNAAYALELDVPSDVLVIDRLVAGDTGGVSLNLPGCATADLQACSTGGSSPLRLSKRNVNAGSYRVVVADQKGLSSQVLALVRPTIAPVSVTTSDNCVDAITIPETGGYFVGDTTSATADFDAGCDATGQPIGGAKDQILRLVLTQRRRVVFDMIGSSYATILDVRSGDACPGVEVPDACAEGAGANRSYLDAGTYWVQVDGYGGTVGAWDLDVRVLPPAPP